MAKGKYRVYDGFNDGQHATFDTLAEADRYAVDLAQSYRVSAADDGVWTDTTGEVIDVCIVVLRHELRDVKAVEDSPQGDYADIVDVPMPDHPAELRLQKLHEALTSLLGDLTKGQANWKRVADAHSGEMDTISSDARVRCLAKSEVLENVEWHLRKMLEETQDVPQTITEGEANRNGDEA